MSLSVSSVNYAGKPNKIGYVPSYGNNPSGNSAETKTGKLSTTEKVLIGAGALALAAIGAYAIVKGKSTSLKNVKFNKGIAQVNGENYTGKIKHTFESGKKVVLECKDGSIVKSTIKDGENAITKTFGKDEAGNKIVKIVKNGEEKVVNLTEKRQAVLEKMKKPETGNPVVPEPAKPTAQPEVKKPDVAPKPEKPVEQKPTVQAEPKSTAQPEVKPDVKAEVKPQKVITPENATPADLWCMGKEHEAIVDKWVKEGRKNLYELNADEYYDRIGKPDKALKVFMNYFKSYTEELAAKRRLYADLILSSSRAYIDTPLRYIGQLGVNSDKAAQEFYDYLKKLPLEESEKGEFLKFIKTSFVSRGYDNIKY